jgi:hypothetical protein
MSPSRICTIVSSRGLFRWTLCSWYKATQSCRPSTRYCRNPVTCPLKCTTLHRSFLLELRNPEFLDKFTNTLQRMKFFEFLEWGIPDFVLCRDCKVLHLAQKPLRGVPFDKDDRPRDPSRIIRLERLCETVVLIGVSDNSMPNLPRAIFFSQLQLFMKRHRVGLRTELLYSR